ncbi:MAG TPA: sugar transferase [Thermoanaerobaculia bacterium]|nr:sugar transferase [Thermoanaerobaculia bacterium]
MSRKLINGRERPRVVHAQAGPHELDQLDETRTGVFWLDLATLDPVGARVKRILDVVVSITLILVAAPFLLLIAVLIKASSRGPAIFRQERIGFRCNRFAMYKFRTMYAGAERTEAELAEQEGKAFLKIERDPRITPLGKFLRKYSLDELPQLFNVLEGTMSLVGPRPLLLSDLTRFPRRSQMRRFSMKPGLTGLWQVSGRSSCDDQQRMELDRRYVSEWSLWLDLSILIRTVRVVLSGEDAF